MDDYSGTIEKGGTRHQHGGLTIRPEPRARTPPDSVRLKLKKPKKKAAGIPAVTSSAMHGLSKMGPVKTIKTLRMVNQKKDLIARVALGPTQTIVPCLNSVKTVQKLLQMKR